MSEDEKDKRIKELEREVTILKLVIQNGFDKNPPKQESNRRPNPNKRELQPKDTDIIITGNCGIERDGFEDGNGNVISKDVWNIMKYTYNKSADICYYENEYVESVATWLEEVKEQILDELQVNPLHHNWMKDKDDWNKIINNNINI